MREKLIELLCHYLIPEVTEEIADHLIENNVVIQKQGKWEVHIDEDDCEYARCTVCGEEFYDGDNDTIDRLPKYCKECGARMDVD